MWIIIYSIRHNCQAISDDYFFDKTPHYFSQAHHHVIIIKRMFSMKLMKQILWSLYRPGHQLGVKHYVQSINTKMPLGLLPPTIYLDRIAHCLKSMKREPYRQ